MNEGYINTQPPGKPDSKKKYISPFEEINRVKKMFPNAKWICHCGTPVYEEGGECPNCGDWYYVITRKD